MVGVVMVVMMVVVVMLMVIVLVLVNVATTTQRAYQILSLSFYDEIPKSKSMFKAEHIA